MWTVLYQLLPRMIALTIVDGPGQLKDYHYSRTTGQFRFVKTVASIEAIAIGLGWILQFEWTHIPEKLCSRTCMCWWRHASVPASYKLRVTSYELQAKGYTLQATRYKLRAAR